MSTATDREHIKRYREHNVTRDERFPKGSPGGVVRAEPVPHELQCRCDACRDVRQRMSRTVAVDGSQWKEPR